MQEWSSRYHYSGGESSWNTRAGACALIRMAVSTITFFSNPSVTLQEEGGLWKLKGRSSLSTSNAKQERALKFVQCSPSTISLFLPLASRHLSAFWKDVKKFNHHRERARAGWFFFGVFLREACFPLVHRGPACCFCVGLNRPANWCGRLDAATMGKEEIKAE